MGWYRGIAEVEVLDSDVAPVCGLSVSITREHHEGGGEGEEAGKQPRTYPSTVRPCIEPSTPPRVTTPSTRPHTYKMCVYVY